MSDRSRLAALVLVLLTAGSSGAWAQSAPANASAIADATQAALTWLAIVDGGQLGQSWDAAAPALQQALTKEAWSRAVGQARAPLEPFGPRVLLAAQYAAPRTRRPAPTWCCSTAPRSPRAAR
jgi:hypothetical protein